VALEFRVTTGSNIPIYRQIVDQVRKAIATGSLATGEQLPSVRALAEILVINPNTVARAYADLVHEGVLESQAGKGLFVAQRQQKFSRAERKRRLEQALEAFIHEVLFLDFSHQEIIELLQRKLNEIEEATARK
jgi:GntR family transcriptional regulator